MSDRSPARKRWSFLLRLLVVGGLAGLALIAGANWWVVHQSSGKIVATRALLPVNDVALVLGTSPKVMGGWANPFFEGRMNTAAQLYREGRVRHLLLSGDNGQRGYDEPTAMRKALLARGIPLEAITLDYAGFRTLDSIARAGAVFGLQHFTIVTDDFHQPRAIFLARSFGLDAVGIPSEHVPFRSSKKTRLRELASRVKACLDVYLLHTQPKFSGPPEKIDLVAR
jgi:SanA protein